MPPGFEDLSGVGIELAVSGKGLAEVHYPFGLLVAKRTATCRFSKFIAFKNMKILGWLTIFLQNQPIKGVIDFEKGKVLEVLGYAFHREGCFVKGLVPDFMAPPGNPFFIPPLGINLSDPPGVPVTCRADE